MMTVKMASVLTLSAEKIKKQVRFAAAMAINDTAGRIKAAETKLIGSTFEHPRPFTVGSVGLGPIARPDRLVRRVFIKDKTAAYLSAYERGGEHYLPDRPELGRVILEPVHMPVDAFGQIRKAQLAQILARPDVFTGEVHGILGVWRRVKTPAARRRPNLVRAELGLPTPPRSHLVLLAKVIANRAVPKHLGFVEQGLDLAEYLLPTAMEKALARALVSAR